MIGAVAALTVAGFIMFVAAIPTARDDTPPSADGIVVLTGAASRISDALNLLQEGHARRLLITGVNPKTTRADIRRQEPHHTELFTCCVDIGRQATDTVGNAREASHWQRNQKFRSLIVVTSNYHMPRSLAEFSRAMPGVELSPYPVVTNHFSADPWWTYPGTLRLVFSEYVKYLAAKTRHYLADPPARAFAVSPKPEPMRPAHEEQRANDG